MSLDLVWVPDWGKPADAPSRFAFIAFLRDQLPRLPPSEPTAQLFSAAAKRELQLLRDPLAEPAQSALRRCPGSTLHRLAAGRSPECWRRLQLLIACDVERHPGPVRHAPPHMSELFTANTGTNFTKALKLFHEFLRRHNLFDSAGLSRSQSR